MSAPDAYVPPVCDAGHGPMSLIPDGRYRRLHVCTVDGCGRSAFSEEAPPQLPRCVDCGRPMPTGRCTLGDCFSTWGTSAK